jgi:hypothetical protein
MSRSNFHCQDRLFPWKIFELAVVRSLTLVYQGVNFIGFGSGTSSIESPSEISKELIVSSIIRKWTRYSVN